MSVRKQLVTAVATMVLASAFVASAVHAQCSSPGVGGSTRTSVVVAGDPGQSLPVTSSFDLDLFTRFRLTTLTMFSWGREPVGHPGSVRSSFAVLRERLGLKR